MISKVMLVGYENLVFVLTADLIVMVLNSVMDLVRTVVP